MGGVSPVCILMLNPGHVGRSGAGDLEALVGDQLAALGYPVYRFDFPGLGDTYGELPGWETDYFRFIQEGGNTDMALGLIEFVNLREEAQNIVLIGLCGGAITALFAASRASESIQGIAILDTDFSLLTPREDSDNQSSLAQSGVLGQVLRFAKKVRHPQTWLRFFTGENRFRSVLRPLRSILLPLAQRLLGDDLPGDANRPLIDSCRRVVDRGIVILSVTAAGKLREIYLHQVEPTAFGEAREAQFQQLSIPNTNHVFTAGGAKTVVVRKLIDWVDSNWPHRRTNSASSPQSTTPPGPELAQ